nr:hypothetical protein [Tanacetum cinerariifolium]
MDEGDIDNLTMEQYLALTRGNQAPGVVKPKIRGNEGDETLYRAWERYNDLLYKCPTHEINSHQKVNIFYNVLGIMNHQLLDSQGPTSGMTPAQALTAIQTMADNSQKWQDGSSSRNIDSSSYSGGITAIVSKLDRLGRDIKKLKENLHAIQVGCQICDGAYLDKECPLNEEVQSIEEVKYGEFGIPFLNNNRNNEAAKRHVEQDEWLKRFYQCTETNREAHDKIIQGLKTKTHEGFIANKPRTKEDEKIKMNPRYGKVCKMIKERILKDHWSERFGDKEDDNKENIDDPEKYGEDKANVIMRDIHNKLNDDWFNSTSEEEDNLEGILDYLEPKSYDGLIDFDYKAYKKRKCRLLGLTYKEPRQS